MISYIHGKLAYKNDASVVLDVSGIYYEIFLPGAVMKGIETHTTEDGFLKLVTFHYHQIEPSRSTPMLVGFLSAINTYL